MIGLDTNVLVRYIAQDDDVQSPLATQIIDALTTQEPGYVSLVSVVELVWVLSRCYGQSREDLCRILETLLRTKELFVAHTDILWQALRRFKGSNADFADSLIECCGREAGCDHTVTFDRGAAKHCDMRLLA